MAKGQQLDLESAASLIRPRDVILCGFAVGQPVGLLEAIGARQDLEELVLYTGILIRPYAFIQNPKVRIVSGFFGPIERAARAAGWPVEFLAADFHGLERLARRMKPRVVLAVTSAPDAAGWLNFGLQAGASYRAFRDAMSDPERLAIAEVNARLPRVPGLPELGNNRVHVSEVDAWVAHDAEPPTLPHEEPSEDDRAIARLVAAAIEDGSTLQFGIGAMPDEVARLLATGDRGDFGIHTEMIADGVMHLHRSGKVANRKGLYDGVTVATFALGSGDLYAWLDGNPAVRILPVSNVNDPALMRQLQRFVSINGALAIDLTGQIAADHIASRQYSGVGGHESFVTGASEAPGGRSFLCFKSTVTVHGERRSTIVRRLPEGTLVTTPRHHVQYVVTEHGIRDLSVLSDVERERALIELAHPDFRAALRAG